MFLFQVRNLFPVLSFLCALFYDEGKYCPTQAEVGGK